MKNKIIKAIALTIVCILTGLLLSLTVSAESISQEEDTRPPHLIKSPMPITIQL